MVAQKSQGLIVFGIGHWWIFETDGPRWIWLRDNVHKRLSRHLHPLSLAVRRVYRTGKYGIRWVLDRQGGLLLHFQYFDGILSSVLDFYCGLTGEEARIQSLPVLIRLAQSPHHPIRVQIRAIRRQGVSSMIIRRQSPPRSWCVRRQTIWWVLRVDSLREQERCLLARERSDWIDGRDQPLQFELLFKPIGWMAAGLRSKHGRSGYGEWRGRVA